MTERRIEALLLDRDGTLIDDVPYNGDPHLVRPRPTVAAGLSRARRHGIRLAIVSNQSGVARGLLTAECVEAVNRRVSELLGPFDSIVTCPHDDRDNCECRKPRPGMLLTAAREIGVPIASCMMIGDIGTDIDAARAADATGILVPTAMTRAEELDAAPIVLPDFDSAVRHALELGTR